jgi:arylsulfatase A-like enzyme
MSDQQRFDALGAVNPGVRTPALDRLAKEGVRFDRMYVAQALCTPSRATIFTGLYPHTHKLQDNVYGIDNVLADPKYNLSVVWPALLQKAGYHTGYVGKWHLGEKGPPCFDEYDGFNSGVSHWMGKPQKSQWRPDQETDQAIKFLERNKDKRFALCVSYYPPHTPYNPPAKYTAMYEKSDLKPAAYWGGVTAIDACVGRLVEKLDSLGLGQQTLVIFTSDHGDHFGLRPGGSDHKEVPYEETARVPLILRLPGAFEGGKVRTELVSNVDLMPTILDVAGAAIPGNLQGMSLVPVGHGSVKGWRTLVCTENGNAGKHPTSGNSRGIRTDRYKLILRQKAKKGVPGIYELYDLQKDPLEKTNLFAKEQAEVIRGILDQFVVWAKASGDALGLDLAGRCRRSIEDR